MTGTPRSSSCVAAAAGLAFLAFATPAPAGGVQQGETGDGGLTIRWSYEPDTQNPALGRLDVQVEDALAHTPVRYEAGAIMGWLQRDRKALSDAETSCAQKVRALVSSGVGRRADIDLNEYRLVTLNTDGSVVFIDPFVGFNNAKMEAIVDLKAEPVDWIMDGKRMMLWVLAGTPQRLLAIDLQSRQVTRTIPLPDGANAQQLVQDLNGDRLLVAMPGSARLGMVDMGDAAPALRPLDVPGLERLLPVQHIESKSGRSGPDAAAILSGNRIAFMAEKQLSAAWMLADQPSALAFSSLTNRTVAATASGTIHQAKLAGDQIRDAVPALKLDHPVTAMWLFDEGRRLFAIGNGRGSVVDLASNAVTMTFATPPDADRILETGNFIYALGRQSGRAALFARDDLKRGRNQPTDVMVSSANPPGTETKHPEVSRAAASPGGNGILVASVSDGMIYQYSEGMMAPIGSYSNYRRSAVGLQVADYSLKEIAPGHYRGVVRATSGGAYELILAGARPRFAGCARLTLAGSDVAQAPAASPLQAELLATAATPGAGGLPEQRIRIRILEQPPGKSPVALTGLRDLNLLVFDRHSGWQRRTGLREGEAGVYETTVSLPRTSRYTLLVSSPSINLSYVEGSMGERVLGAQP